MARLKYTRPVFQCCFYPTAQHWFILFRFISLLLRNFHGMQLFSARGAILLIIELAPSMEEEEEKKSSVWSSAIWKQNRELLKTGTLGYYETNLFTENDNNNKWSK